MPRAIFLKSRPSGEASSDNFDLRQWPDEPLDDGDVRMAMRYISVDPYLRGRMNDCLLYTSDAADE